MYTNASQPNPPPIAVAAAAAAKVMSAVVQEQGGSAAFVTVYRQTLNWVPPPPPPAPPAPSLYGTSSGGVNSAVHHNRSKVHVAAIAVTVPCGVAILLVAVVLAMWSRHRRLGRRASIAAAPGAGPDTTLLVTGAYGAVEQFPYSCTILNLRSREHCTLIVLLGECGVLL